MEYGLWAEQYKARQFPRLRWNFPWRHYVLVGVPDGLGPDFVYEFKTAGNPFLAKFALRPANAQADLYALLFKKPKKKVEFLVRGEHQTTVSESPADTDAAEELLQKFAELDGGALPRPPKPFKCNSCGYREQCRVAPV
jgi:CRISPR/Cas system-associated exonuclease Cas4 (RecB family)